MRDFEFSLNAQYLRSSPGVCFGPPFRDNSEQWHLHVVVCWWYPLLSRDWNHFQKNILESWNYLKMNAAKCKYMAISHKQFELSSHSFQVYIDNQPIKKVSTYLGMDLPWHVHTCRPLANVFLEWISNFLDFPTSSVLFSSQLRKSRHNDDIIISHRNACQPSTHTFWPSGSIFPTISCKSWQACHTNLPFPSTHMWVSSESRKLATFVGLLTIQKSGVMKQFSGTSDRCQ